MWVGVLRVAWLGAEIPVAIELEKDVDVLRGARRRTRDTSHPPIGGLTERRGIGRIYAVSRVVPVISWRKLLRKGTASGTCSGLADLLRSGIWPGIAGGSTWIEYPDSHGKSTGIGRAAESAECA